MTRSRLVSLVCALVLAAQATAGDPPPTIAPDALIRQIEDGAAPFILDVRTPDEYRKGHIPGAINIPYDELANRLGELGVDRSEVIVVYCRTGRRAILAESTLLEAGYTGAADLEGHWREWTGPRASTN